MLSRMDLLGFKLRLEAGRGLGFVVLFSFPSLIVRKYRETKDGDLIFLESVSFSTTFLESLYPNVFRYIESYPFFLSYCPLCDTYECYFLGHRKPCIKLSYFCNKDLVMLFSLCDASLAKECSVSLERIR